MPLPIATKRTVLVGGVGGGYVESRGSYMAYVIRKHGGIVSLLEGRGVDREELEGGKRLRSRP